MQYNSITRRPDDLSSSDGDLAIAINLINEDGALRPLEQPTALFDLPTDSRLIYIHKGTGFTNYIVRSKSDLVFITDSDMSEKQISTGEEGIEKHITSIGNTLIVTTNKGTFYALFTDDKYNWLGQKPPFTSISFGLNGDFTVSDSFTIIDDPVDSNFIPRDSVGRSFSLKDIENCTKNVTQLTDITLANVNKFIQDKATQKGKFIFPFFVRYAYRLFDGSLFMHSSPILLIPSSYCNPTVFATAINMYEDGDIYLHIKARVAALICNLDYSIPGIETNLSRWKDIVKAVEIYISAPIYTYDQAGKVYGWDVCDVGQNNAPQSKSFAIAKINNPHAKWKGNSFHASYLDQPFAYQYACAYDTTQTETMRGPNKFMTLPRHEDKEINAKIGECSLFYKIHSIDLENLATCKHKNIELSETILSSLTSRQQMTDDYNSHNLVNSETAFAYNSRINLANITETIFAGTPSIAQLTNYDVHSTAYTPIYVDIVTSLKKQGRKIVVRNSTIQSPTNHVGSTRPYYLFFPDTDAYEMVIMPYYILDGVRTNLSEILCPLKEHPLLNGAYFFNGFTEKVQSTNVEPMPTGSTVRYPSKIYTSEVNNPFVFNPTNINTLGVASITALSSATKALSQGQFGQFPLYAFTSEGIWAMEVNATGGYSTKQPISRDVIIGDPLQLDSAVAFNTERGIMIISGSESTCISDQLRGAFDVSKFPKLTDIITKLNHSPIKNCDLPKKPFMAYDYARARILIYPQDGDEYAWAYSLKSRSWSMSSDTFTGVINSYPETILTRGNLVFRLSDANYDIPNKACILSRPIKFSSLDLKTIYSLRTYAKANIATALYATIDMMDYTLIKSSMNNEINNIAGSPYRAFVVLLIADIYSDSYITSTQFNTQTKLNNKFR